MKYFKVGTEIRAIEECQEFLIQDDWLEISLEEMMDITNPPLTDEQIEVQRISSIKAKAEQLITAKYSIIWQLNHPRLDESYKDDYAYIDRIRDISNEAETNGTALEDINWNKDV